MVNNDLKNKLIGDIPHNIAVHKPQSKALISGDRTCTYLELEKLANQFANGLLALGPAAQTKVVIMCSNSIEYPVVHFGTARTACVLVHVPYRYGAEELKHVLEQTQAQFLIGDSKTFNLYQSIQQQLRKPPQLIGIGNGLPAACTRFDDLIQGQLETAPDITIDADDPTCIMYTSGTTGRSKGAIASHFARIISSTSAAEDYPLEHADIAAVTTPLSHAAGLFTWFQPLMISGACAVLMEKWDTATFMQMVERHAISCAFVVPTQLNMLLDDPNFSTSRLSSLKKLAYGGAEASAELLRRAEQLLPQTRIILAYGSTESSHLICKQPEERKARPESLGKPGARIEVSVYKAPGVPAAPGEPGEIVSRGPHLMQGYLDAPEETAAYFKSADGWGWTGDLGTMDENGVITLLGRTKEIIISGGINISPLELEAALSTHDAVAECAAFGLADHKWGELPAAAVVLKAGANASEAELLDYSTEKLARFKRVRQVFFVDSIPRTNTGKVQRALLKQRFTDKLRDASSD